MRIVHARGAADPRVADFTGLTDVAARSAREPREGLFIAEGAKVIARALETGHRPRRLLTEATWLDGLAPLLEAVDVEVVVAEPEVLREITGYSVHRGALAAMERRPLAPVTELLDGAGLVVVLVDLVDHTNVGSVFRNCAALGADAVLVTQRCADPMYRRSVKVSMGAVLALPWTRTGTDPLSDLAGFTSVALTPAADALDIDEVRARDGRLALLLGTEGDGLDPRLMARADVRARIPMARGIDSLNVAAASAVALHAMRRSLAS